MPTSEREGDASSAPAEPSPQRAERSLSKSQLRLGIWNIKWLNDTPGSGTVKRSLADYKRLQEYGAALRADIIALAEVDGPEAAARVFPSTEYSFHFAKSGVQGTGFAYRTGLPLTPNPDLESLSIGGLRAGADMSLHTHEGELRLLAVHLKSGCFRGTPGSGKACRKLVAQVPIIEEWMEARYKEGVPFIVMGDFNRALFAEANDPIWADWNDNTPPGFSLTAPTQGSSPRCWDAKYPDFIDHFLLSPRPALHIKAGSFKEHLYGAQRKAYRSRLSDHCALTIELDIPLKLTSPSPSARPKPRSPETPTRSALPDSPIKGNISRDGRKLYHRPDCPSYKDTRITPEKGEAFFTTVEAAEAQGFVLAGNCAPIPPNPTK